MASQLEHFGGVVEALGDGLPRRRRPGEPGGAAILKKDKYVSLLTSEIISNFKY